MSDEVRIVYVANVGTRDLTLDDAFVAPPRRQGEELLGRYDEVRHRLAAPILEPGLRHALRSAGRVDLVVLFASDQPETTPAKYRDNDTIFLAELIRRRLAEHEELAPHVGRVVVERISGNPADYGAMLAFYERALPAVVPERVTTVYVAPVGGADASNVGLWLTALRRFGSRVEMIYVMPDGSVEELPVARLLLRDFRRHQALTLLHHYEYAPLAELVETFPEWGGTWVPHLLRAQSRRLRFDFQGAVEALEAATAQASGQARARLERLREDLKAWQAEIPPPRADDNDEQWEAWLRRQREGLAELYWNAAIKAARHEWVDFLGRLFRLVEGVQRLIFEQETRHSTERIDGSFADFTAALRADEELMAFLEQEGVRGLDGEEITPNTFVLFTVIRYWVERAGRGRQLGPVYGVVKKVRELSDLRNKTIIAHGWQGVSRGEVERQAKGSVEELLEELRRALEAIGVPVGAENPHDEINEWVQQRLEREM